MCNKCECENMDQCSIIGYMPVDYCCENCQKLAELCSSKYSEINEENSEL